MHQTKKGQIAITDLYIAIVVFIIVVGVVVSFWNIYSSRYAQELDYREMELTAFSVTNLLIKNQGNPSGWENLDFLDPQEVERIEVLGLAYNDRNLSDDKVDAFFLDLSDENVSKFLNVEKYNTYFNLTNMNDVSLIEGKGSNPGINPEDVNQMIRLRKIVNYDNQPALFYFTLWN